MQIFDACAVAEKRGLYMDFSNFEFIHTKSSYSQTKFWSAKVVLLKDRIFLFVFMVGPKDVKLDNFINDISPFSFMYTEQNSYPRNVVYFWDIFSPQRYYKKTFQFQSLILVKVQKCQAVFCLSDMCPSERFLLA